MGLRSRRSRRIIVGAKGKKNDSFALGVWGVGAPEDAGDCCSELLSSGAFAEVTSPMSLQGRKEGVWGVCARRLGAAWGRWREVFAREMITRRFSMIRATQPTLAFGTGTIVMSVLDNV